MSGFIPSFNIIWIFGMLIFIGAVAAIIIFAVKNAADRSGKEIVTRAVVRSKRAQVAGMERVGTYYHVTFEFENGERLELPVDGRTYGRLAEGDIGYLKRKGMGFVDFVRDPSPVFEEDGAHKCSGCGAVYEGRVCPYCNTPFLKED